MTDKSRCRLLELPTELRLLIYSFAVLSAPVISVGTAKLVGSAPDIEYRQFGANRSPINGIPRHTEPVIETNFDANLVSGKAIIDLHSSSAAQPSHLTSSGTSYQSLLRLNRQINSELRSHVHLPAHQQTNLFLNYPHGLHVLQTLTPELLRQSRTLRVCGSFSSQALTIPRNTLWQCSPSLSKRESLEALQGDIVPDAGRELSRLVKDTFGPNARNQVEKLELRIYYPGDSYPTVWSEDSPIAIALRNIARGKIEMVVRRGRHGNGVHLNATPATKCERSVSTVWRKLEEGGPGQPEAGSFVIDPSWDRAPSVAGIDKSDIVSHSDLAS